MNKYIEKQEKVLRDGIQHFIENSRTRRIREADDKLKQRAIEHGVKNWRQGNCTFTQAKDAALELLKVEAAR